jgi:hypothetical protein
MAHEWVQFYKYIQTVCGFWNIINKIQLIPLRNSIIPQNTWEFIQHYRHTNLDLLVGVYRERSNTPFWKNVVY